MAKSLMVAVLVAAPLSLFAEGVTIDPKPAECVVAEQFPKFGACFTPAEELAKGRLYFRSEGGPFWYFVEMKADAPCHTGILPKPKKELKKIELYMEAVGKDFTQSRTKEFSVQVVGSKADCKEKPVAPFLSNASVTVGAPAGAATVPAGFAAAGVVGAAGFPAAVVVGVGAAGAAGGIVAATHHSSSTTTTPTVPTLPTTTPTPAPSPSPTPTPIPSPSPAGIFFPDIRVSPDPPSGPPPLDVTFNMCNSSDSLGRPLSFTYSFGDGSNSSGPCRLDHIYNFSPSHPTYLAHMCVSNGVQTACKDFTVTVSCPAAPAPTISIFPSGTQTAPVNFTANVSSANPITAVDYFSQAFSYCQGSNPPVAFAHTTVAPYSALYPGCASSAVFAQCGLFDFVVTAHARDFCGNVGVSNSVTVFPNNTCAAGIYQLGDAKTVRWSSSLYGSASGQVVLNGVQASAASNGRSYSEGRVRVGDNRVEARTLAGTGAAGSWRFEFAGAMFLPGTLRVIAGEVVEVTDSTIVFRIRGTGDERVVFTFKAR